MTTSWNSLRFFSSAEWARIQKTIRAQQSTPLQPAYKDIFRPLIETPMRKVKVVILGSEPPSMMDADGLAYSYPKTCADPNVLPSVLHNIFEEYIHDLKYPFPKTGSLRTWAKNGVLLWNERPTVRKGYPKSHLNIGWEKLTLEILESLYLVNPNTVYLLWTPDRDKYIDLLPKDAKIVDSGSPALAANGEFWASSPFSKANAILEATGQKPVVWRLP